MMYKKFFFIIMLSAILFACAKKSATTDDCNTTGIPSITEIANLQAYLKTNNISATQDARGFFYVISAPGTGANPNINSNLTVQYKGKFLSGAIFDSTKAGSSASFPLSGVITGWQYGVPLIKKGGSIDLYLPPTLAYGCYSNGPIPGNSSLIFNINLLDVQ